MYREIKTYRNGPVPTFEALPAGDVIGSTRKVTDSGKIYICVSNSLLITDQWKEWNPDTKQIVPSSTLAGNVIFTGPVTFQDEAQFASDVTFNETLVLPATVDVSNLPTDPGDANTLWIDAGGANVVKRVPE